MVINDWLLGEIMIIDCFLGEMVISDWLLGGKKVISDRLLGEKGDQ